MLAKGIYHAPHHSTTTHSIVRMPHCGYTMWWWFQCIIEYLHVFVRIICLFVWLWKWIRAHNMIFPKTSMLTKANDVRMYDGDEVFFLFRFSVGFCIFRTKCEPLRLYTFFLFGVYSNSVASDTCEYSVRCKPRRMVVNIEHHNYTIYLISNSECRGYVCIGYTCILCVCDLLLKGRNQFVPLQIFFFWPKLQLYNEIIQRIYIFFGIE